MHHVWSPMRYFKGRGSSTFKPGRRCFESTIFDTLAVNFKEIFMPDQNGTSSPTDRTPKWERVSPWRITFDILFFICMAWNAMYALRVLDDPMRYFWIGTLPFLLVEMIFRYTRKKKQ